MVRGVGRWLLLLVCVCGVGVGSAQRTLRVACYNVESLYDTLPHPSLRDREYTPQGALRWNSERYQTKLAHLARVVEDLKADLIALEEVESETAVRDLVSTLRSDYNYLYCATSDRRGMSQALLYRGAIFCPSKVKQVHGSGLPRELLVVEGDLLGDTVTLVVCHLPSMMNPASLRNGALQSLRQVVDRLYRENPEARFLVLGDFNRDPADRMMGRLLGVRDANPKVQPTERKGLYTPFRALARQGYGTLIYQDRRQLFDYILLRESLCRASQGLRFTGRAAIFVAEYMLFTEGTWKGYPRRSFRAGEYEAGYSDHLPVWVELQR
ncbi:MAG: endonuclease/exonuclease/phosphatase family protein [Alistipes sp.]|nr:endonuclease/exonuclease/phosphatase family protein [Alistipes sp.]